MIYSPSTSWVRYLKSARLSMEISYKNLNVTVSESYSGVAAVNTPISPWSDAGVLKMFYTPFNPPSAYDYSANFVGTLNGNNSNTGAYQTENFVISLRVQYFYGNRFANDEDPRLRTAYQYVFSRADPRSEDERLHGVPLTRWLQPNVPVVFSKTGDDGMGVAFTLLNEWG